MYCVHFTHVVTVATSSRMLLLPLPISLYILPMLFYLYIIYLPVYLQTITSSEGGFFHVISFNGRILRHSQVLKTM